MTRLDAFGDWATQHDPATFPWAVLGDHVMDTVGAWLAGSVTEDGRALARLCTGGMLGIAANHPLDQVLRRVGQTRLTEIDDIHLPTCTTPGSVVVITALTLATALEGVQPERFAIALRAGYGAMTWLNTVIKGAEIFYRGIWPTYYAAPAGAAAVTATLLGLNAGQVADAVALALTCSSGGIGNLPGLTPRWLLIGQAARAGCVAALAVADGYSGDRSLLDGDWLKRVHGLDVDPAPIPVPPDGGIATLSTKPICAARQTQSAIAAFRHLLSTGLEPATIKAIRVLVPPNFASLIDHRRTASRMGRVSSIGYVLALAAYRPDALYDVARAERVSEPAFEALMDSVTVTGDPSLLVHYPQHWPASVELQLADGRVLSHTVISAPGDPLAPPQPGELREKFHRLATQKIDGQTAGMLRTACLGSLTDASALASLCTLTRAL
jgi:2-methylcitrate dehydratase PrpD